MAYSLTLDEVKARSAVEGRVPIYRELLADLDTPVSAYRKIAGDGRGFLLESVENGERSARYSFLGGEPRATLSYQDGIARLTRDSAAPREWTCTDPLAALQELLGTPRLRTDGLPPFCGGAVGYLGFEIAGCYERLPRGPKAEPTVPDAVFMLADPVVVFDHVLRTVKVITTIAPEDPDGIEAAYQAALIRIDETCRRLAQPTIPPTLSKHMDSTQAEPTSNVGKERHEASVERAIEYIHAGDAIQVVLSQRLTRPFNADSFTLYRALRTVSPSPYMVYLNFGEFSLVGASVETLLKVTGDRLYYHPIAGTRRRGVTTEEDLALEQELRNDVKERAEHVMLVDLGRNDLGRVAETGSVQVTDLMEIERFSHVMHMVSTVEARLAPGQHPFDALRSAFPAGTVSGAPKIRAMEIISELEPHQRGPYAGSAGYFDYSGDLDTAITIRTALVHGGNVYIQAGGGIVADSEPSEEWQETMHKAGGMLRAVNVAERLADFQAYD
ncbi:MAG: anthranilate synthase aminase component [Chloroflexi bacterium]|nr:anthranilate synthase aminase component [Chloroflexota bacterium]